MAKPPRALRRLVLPVTLALAAAAIPLGCAGDSFTVEDIARAASKTESAGTARVAVTISIDNLETAPGPLTARGEGRVDLDELRGMLVMDLTELREREGDDADPRMEVRYDGFVWYVRSEAVSEELDAEPWLKFDLEELGKEVGIDISQLTGVGDPTKGLRYLRTGSRTVETVGKENVRGVATTHYRATVDLRRVLDAAPDVTAASIESFIDELGTETILTDVWIDEEGLVRRYSEEYDTTLVSGAKAHEKDTVEFFAFGVPVEVEAPPEREVTDVAELLEEEG